MQRSEFRHYLELPVRWGDMDAFGHVNNVQYYRYLESGRIAYVEEVMRASLEASESVILADLQCSFLTQLHYPVVIEVATRIGRIGNSSLHLASAIYRKGEERPVATSKGVMVWFDLAKQRPAPVPAMLRERILAFEPVRPEC